MFLLGFLGTRFTTSIPERYFGYVISVSIKLFVIFLIVGLGDTLGQHLKEVLTAATQNGAIPAPGVYLEVMAGALTYMILAWHLPSLAGSMLSGAPALTLGAAATTTAMLTAAVSNGVIQGMRQMAANPRQATNALAGAVKLGQAAKMGIGEKLRGGASLSSAVGNTLGDISLTASQQFRDSVIRGTGRESAAAAEKAAWDNAVQGWGRRTTLGNLTNRMHANRDGASIETKAGDTGAKGATGGVNRITPPPIPNDQTHGSGNITIRFKE